MREGVGVGHEISVECGACAKKRLHYKVQQTAVPARVLQNAVAQAPPF